MRTIVATLFTCASLFAQISDLATTDDGAQLYFSSPLRVRSGDENFNQKIIRYVGDFETFREATFTLNATPWRTSYYKLLAPQVTGGGTIVAWTSQAACYACCDCFNAQPLNRSNTAGTDVILPLDYGGILLSGDGRFALYNYTDPSLTGFLNVATGAVTPLYPYSETGDGKQAFTDDGRVLLDGNNATQPLILWDSTSPSNPVSLHLSRVPMFAHISRNGAKVIYEAANGTGRVLAAFDVAGGAETTLATIATVSQQFAGSYFKPVVSIDGTQVAFLNADSSGVTQSFIMPTSGGTAQQLTHEPAGISEAVLSGNGNMLYAVTTRSGLLQIGLPSGALIRLADPAVVTSLSPTAPGSSTQLYGSGLTSTTAVILNDEPAPLLFVSDSVIVFQMPWDARTDIPATVRVIGSADSPFEAGVLTPGPQGSFPAPLSAVNGSLLLAIHQGFMSLITASSPARAGEVATLYATGLGPVTGSVQAGVPAPTNGALQFLTGSMTCQVAEVNAPVLFAGLAPGLIGIYQVNLLVPSLPAGINPLLMNLACSVASGGTLEGGLFVPFPVTN